MPQNRQKESKILVFITRDNNDCFSWALYDSEFIDDLLALLIDPFLNFNTELITVEQENNNLNRIMKGSGACVCLFTRGMWTLQINMHAGTRAPVHLWLAVQLN